LGAAILFLSGVFIMADWSDADIKTVKSMWQRGATATEIAAALGPGVTRGAVLGKVHRLGLKRAEEAKARPRATAAAARPGQAKNGAKPILKAVAGVRAAAPPQREPEPAGPRPIWALGQCQCRWPIGNLLDPPGLFCGAVTVDGSSWCEAHARLVYTGTMRPRPETAPVPAARLAAFGGRSRF
jgi:GcrA cell cycle regulator